MKTTPAPERGAGSDDPTGPRLWQDRPDGNLWEGIVRTSFSNAEHYQSNADSRGSLSTATAIPAEAGACPLTRPAACRRSDPPDHRQRVCGKAQSRWIDCCSPSTAAVGCGAISCIHGKVPTKCVNPCGRASDLGELA